MGERNKYDLEDRTFEFANNCKHFIKELSRINYNVEYSKQLIRSSGSVAANYIEANESLSKKDFIHRVKICRKEAKESRLWLRLIDCNSQDKRDNLINETIELVKIFSTIIEKSLK